MSNSPEEPDTAELEEQDEPGPPVDPVVDPSDVGLPSDPNLDDDNVVVTPPNADDVPGSSAG